MAPISPAAPVKPTVAGTAAKMVTPSVSPSGAPPVSARGAPPFKLSPVRRESRWFKILIYGKHGLGKTTLGGSAADVDAMADVFHVDAEAGDLTFENNERIIHHDRILSAKASDFMTIGRMYEFMSSHCVFRDQNTPEAEAKLKDIQSWLTGVPVAEIEHVYRFRTVLFDSLSEAEQMNMSGLMGYDEEKLLAGAADDIEVSGWGEFRKNKMMVEMLVRRFRNLPIHFIVICGEAYSEDEIKRKSWTPALTGQLTRTIQGPFDVVGHLTMGDKDAQGNQPRLLRVKPDGRSAAKCRFSSFKGDGFSDPTMLKIMSAVGLLGQQK